MASKFGTWWQKIRKPRGVIGIIAACIGVVVLVFVEVRSYGTGFVGKTLWDWLQLLIIPAALTLGAIWYTARQNHDREIAADNQHEAVLQTYLDKMSELLLEKNLRGSQEKDEVQNIARVRTLAVLSSLDNRRKGNVLQFLYESDLINKNTPIIYLGGADLSGADLSGTFHKAFPWEVYQDIVDTPWENIAAQFGANLSGAHLWGTILNGADLSRACLHDSNLRAADLRDANLSGADLSEANLVEANLGGANLRGADLRDTYLNYAYLGGADLRDTNLSGADLSGATTTKKQLRQAKSLKGATMPGGKIYP